MSLVSLKDIEKSYGADKVLRGAGFSIGRGDRAGLVGMNGCGKTTLLKVISGDLKPDSGHIAVARRISIGYLAQKPAEADASVLEEMLSSKPQVLELKHRLDLSARTVSDMAADGGKLYERSLDEYGRLLEEYETTGGYAYDNAVTGALIGLGFGREDFGRAVGSLSGGERTRLSLAKLLLAGHDILLLDEPTNHLDIPSINWLETFLKEYKGAALIVSHDRYFLDSAVDRIIELENGLVEEYPGNYSAYRVEKEVRTEARLRQFELASARLDKEKEYINRMRAGVHARQAKGREKRLGSLALPDRPVTSKSEIRLTWEDTARSSDSVLKLDGVSKSFGRTEVLKDISFTLRRGEKAGVIGRNGSGKSTLIKLIMGSLAPDSGTVKLGPKVMPAYYSQDMEGLDDGNTVLDELWSVSALATEQRVRDLLGAFLFSGDDALKKVGFLSGGEKGRLAIAKVVMQGANLLILDEPTNHLDIPAREALEEAIACFDGTVLAVSHDRYFLDSIADKVFEVEGGGLTEYWGNYTYFMQKKAVDVEEAGRAPSEGRQSWEFRKQQQAEDKKRGRDEKKKAERISRIESDIEGLEIKIKETEDKLADPEVCMNYGLVSELTKCYNSLITQRDELYDLLEKEAF